MILMVNDDFMCIVSEGSGIMLEDEGWAWKIQVIFALRE